VVRQTSSDVFSRGASAAAASRFRRPRAASPEVGGHLRNSVVTHSRARSATLSAMAAGTAAVPCVSSVFAPEQTAVTHCHIT
jgi:hypothetical protein